MTPKLNDYERACFILNPNSGGGRTRSREDEVRREVQRWFSKAEVWPTKAPGHATELAEKAVDDGFDVVVAVGGDGTAHEVVNGLMDGRSARRPEVIFGAIPAGTGSDLVRTLRMPSRLEESVGVLAHGRTVHCDLIAAQVQGIDGPVDEICVNVAGFGLSGDVVDRVNRSGKRFGGTISFASATIQSLVRYQAPHVHLSWIDAHGKEGAWSGEIFSVFLANGAYCGGGMWVGRDGTMNDSVLDLTIIPQLGWPQIVAGAPRLFTGTIAQVPGVLRIPVRTLRAQSNADVLVDLDGEQPGRLDSSFEVLEKVLPIRGLWRDY